MKLRVIVVILITVMFLVITDSFRKGKGNSDVEEKRKTQIGKKKYIPARMKTLKGKKKYVKNKNNAKKKSRRNKRPSKNRKISRNNKKEITTKKKKQMKNLKRKSDKKKKDRKGLKNNRDNNNKKKRTKYRKRKGKGRKKPLNGKRKKKNGKVKKNRKSSLNGKRRTNRGKGKKMKNRKRDGKGQFKVDKSEIIRKTKNLKQNSFILEGAQGVTNIHTTTSATAIAELNIGVCFSYTLNCVALNENTCLSGRDDRFFTATGKLCINWEDGGFENMLLEFEGSPDHNRCMNATNGPYKEGPWCYTSNEGSWEMCYMACTCLLKPPSTVLQLQKHNYGNVNPPTIMIYSFETLDPRSYKNVTNLRQKCIPWYDDLGQPNNRQHPPNEVFHNRCLNPDNDTGGPYCYYGVGRSKWEFCYKSCEQTRNLTLNIIPAERNAGALTLAYNSNGKLDAAQVKSGMLLIIESSINAELTIVGERGDVFDMTEFIKLQFANSKEYQFVNGETVPDNEILTYTDVNQTRGVAVYIAVYSKSILILSVTRKPEVFQKNSHVTVRSIQRCPNDGDTTFAFTVGGHHPDADVRRFPGTTEDTILPFQGYFNKHDAPRSQIGTYIFTLCLIAGKKGDFMISLYHESDIAFQFEVRFTENKIALNDYYGQWGVEKIANGVFPFADTQLGVYEISFDLNKGNVTVVSDNRVIALYASKSQKFTSFNIHKGRNAVPNAVHILSIFNPNNL